jgi:hypothetical protein
VRYGCGLAAPPHCLALVPSNGITTDLLGDATSPPPRQTLAALD